MSSCRPCSIQHARCPRHASLHSHRHSAGAAHQACQPGKRMRASAEQDTKKEADPDESLAALEDMVVSSRAQRICCAQLCTMAARVPFTWNLS